MRILWSDTQPVGDLAGSNAAVWLTFGARVTC